MADYIKRETVVNHLNDCMDTLWKPEIVALKCFVEGLPAADVAPVVRCRDCANFRQNVRGGCWCDEYGGSITPNDYCSRAVMDEQPRAKVPWEAD